MPRPMSILPALSLLWLAGCAAGAVSVPPGAGPGPESARGVPGFDTRAYPGDDAMRAWRASSPYRWVGFYLPAPCYTGTSWHGRRASLQAAGWGLAVLFVGEQSWSAGAGADAPAGEPAGEPPRCTRSNLTPERGRADGTAAARAAAAEGFASGARIFLDVERTEAVTDSLRAYVQAWTDALLDDGRYRPALYAHAGNADALLAAMAEALATRGRAEGPALWVAKSGGFSLRRGPAESGYPAAIWQGLHDVDETWGGVTLRIDANVAESAHPSRSTR